MQRAQKRELPLVLIPIIGPPVNRKAVRSQEPDGLDLFHAAPAVPARKGGFQLQQQRQATSVAVLLALINGRRSGLSLNGNRRGRRFRNGNRCRARLNLGDPVIAIHVELMIFMEVAAGHCPGGQVATIASAQFQDIVRYEVLSVCRRLMEHAVSSFIVAFLAVGVADVELGNWGVGAIVDVI